MDSKQKYVGFILAQFEKEVIPLLRSHIKNQGYVYSGKLFNELSMTKVNLSANEWELMLTFPSYGLALEKSKPFAYNAPIEVLTKWVLATGLDKFKSIPGYDDSNFIPAAAASRIAWAIKMSKTKRQQSEGANYGYRTLQDPINASWFYVPFFGMWKQKKEKVLLSYFEKYPDEIIGEVTKSFQDAVSKMAKHGGTR